MSDRLIEMRVFVRVARLESFARAARELRMSSTAVSRRVNGLEEALGAKLLQRTTRRLSLTTVGRAYLERAEGVLAELAELEEAVTEQHASPSGLLRVAAGVSFAHEQLSPLLPEFLRRYPELTLELDLSDRPVDLIADGIDVAVRIGKLEDSSLVARRLAVSSSALVASRSYLAAHGRPSGPAELADHECIIDLNQQRAWRFVGPDGEESFEPAGRLRVNNAHAVLRAVRDGFGIGLVPTFVSGTALTEGSVETVLDGYEVAPVTLNAIYPASRSLSSRVRVFVDFLAESFGSPPSWDSWMSGR
ncbi:MAG: DNA-binding transcriptional LysR family regulator [Myxococcota bacterium]|jgi:DNA-binding transcriptional LysR family regulator